ncbi:MAG TPA: 2-oxo acid dehydrogenase subunit E2, partial [Solirubrobacteraceae bacterium]|nr:2-oxo acid dehydrogenase subunit E2 [Solirubrobacteraceae bacterium]
MPPGTTTTETIDVVTPAAGESVTEGTILEWHAKVGDFVKVDDTIVEISTDKVDVELPSPASGTVTEILAEEGDTVGVGQVIARLAPQDGASDRAASHSADTSGSPANGDAAPVSSTDGATTAAITSGGVVPDGARVSPVAARAAAAEGVDLTGVSGSGPGGRILKADVLGAGAGGASTANGAAATAAEPTSERTLLKGGAAMLARYMDESRSIPTATSFRTMTVTALEGRRRELKEARKRVSFTHLIAYAIAQAAGEMDVMTHHFAEEGGKPYRVSDGQVNLGLAVDVEKKDGSRTLMVPVIRGADRMSFADFLAAYDALVEQARTNTLTADDLGGGNVTLTNPGGIGTIASVPRLMNGQGTIVATGSIAYPVGLGRLGERIGAEKVMTM